MWKQSSGNPVQPSDSASRRGYGSTQYIDHSLDVASSIANLFGNEAFSDVTLVVQNVPFAAHKVVLAARSEYFRALLYGGLAETSRSIIHLNDISATAFKHVLQYMYMGRINVRKLRTMLDVLGLAHQYDLRGLESALSAHLTHSLRLSNVWLIYNLAVMYNLEELVSACLKFLDGIAPAPLQNSQFLRLSQAAVERLLSRDSFCAAEIDIFRSLCAWFRATQEAEAHQQCDTSTPGMVSNGPSALCSVTTGEGDQTSANSTSVLGKSDNVMRESSGEVIPKDASDPNRVTVESTSDSSNPMDHGFTQRRNRIEARQQHMMRRCVRFELMSLTELLTEVRASTLVSPDDLLDAISRQAKCPDSLPHRGWMLPGVNLASPRFACALISGEEGGYPYFFVDDAEDENGMSNLGEVQFSTSAMDLTTALANGDVLSGDVPVPTEPTIGEDEDEDDDEEDNGEFVLEDTARSRTNDLHRLDAHWQRADATEESDSGGANVHEGSATLMSLGHTVNPSAPVYSPGDQAARIANRLENRNRRSLPGSSSMPNQRQASFPSQPLLSADWYPIVPPESRIAELNQYGAHSVEQNPRRRSTYSFVAPYPYLQPYQQHRSGRRPHIASAAFFQGSGGGTGFSHGPTSDRSMRWLFPVQHRRANAPPHPPPPPHSEHDVVRHSLDDPDAHIVIRLGKPSIVNTIRMQLWDREARCYSYYVEVSLDQVTWHRIVDYRSYPCRSWQTLHFPARVIHFIRVTGTRNTANRTFHLITFRCMYTETVCQQVDGFLIPTYNVASVDHGATVLEGVSRNRNALIDGNARMYDWNSGYTCHQLGNGAIVVQLSQPFLLRSMRLLLWDLDDRTYSYSVHVSTNREDWRLVHDATRERCQSWQIITFPLQLVTFIRVVGSHNTANEVFHLVHLECPYPPAEQQPDDRAASPKEDEHPEVLSTQAVPTDNSEFAGLPPSSGAPSESNSLNEHPSYQATQATELLDNSSVLALDAITDSSVCAAELETRPNSPPITAILERSGTAESLPHLAPVASGSLIHLPDSDPSQSGMNVLDPEPDPSIFFSRLSLDRAKSQPARSGRSNPVSVVDVMNNLTITGAESEPGRPLSRHLSIGSSVCQLTTTTHTAAVTSSTGATSTTGGRYQASTSRTGNSRSSPAALGLINETSSSFPPNFP